MGFFHYKWSRTAASNATADSNVNFAEGQAPSTVNDSARALMASAAGFRDDIAGAITTGGTSTAYTVTSYQVFDSLANMSGQVIAFTPHATNGATVTLNVDGLGAKPLRPSPGVELAAGTLILGTPYTALYNNSDAVWYLHNFYGANPYNVPLMGGLDYWDTVAPNSSFIFPAGQAISRTTYATVFARWGTTYGAGDGSTTFNVPDKTGRVSAMKEASATRLTATYFGASGATMGAVGGSESHTLTTAQLASHTHTGTTGQESANHTHGITGGTIGGSTTFANFGSGAGISAPLNATTITNGTQSAPHTHDITTNAAGSGSAHNNTQPTIICNYIIRVL
jgi:microcystin-dependent protein